MISDARAPTRADIRRKRQEARERFSRVRLAERSFTRQLKQVARQVGTIVRGFAPKGIVSNLPSLTQALSKYADVLRPWARTVAERWVSEIAQRDAKAWHQAAAEIGRDLKSEIRNAPTGVAMRAKLDEAVDLITSLPRQAGERVHKLTIEGMASGARAKEIAKEILKTGHVTASRAELIARTETGRTASALTEARARHIGSEGYIWRTVTDSDVRPSHRKMEGKFVRWDNPPTLDNLTGHAGALPNCRCYPEVLISDKL